MNIFEKAAEILMTGGHCKGQLDNEAGEHCARGALLKAAGIDTADTWSTGGEGVQAVAAKAGKRLVDRGEVVVHQPFNPTSTFGLQYALVQWNNAPERTGEDVVLLFKELAHEDG